MSRRDDAYSQQTQGECRSRNLRHYSTRNERGQLVVLFSERS